MNPTIRAATPADAVAIQALARRVISVAYRPFLGDAGVEGFINSGASDDYIRDHLPASAVMVEGTDILGFCAWRDFVVEMVMIDTPRQRQGLGARLLARCERRLFEFYDLLALESFAPNHQANAFYRKNGWLADRQVFDAASGVDKILFKKNRPD